MSKTVSTVLLVIGIVLIVFGVESLFVSMPAGLVLIAIGVILLVFRYQKIRTYSSRPAINNDQPKFTLSKKMNTENNELRARITELELLMTPEMKNEQAVKNRINDLVNQEKDLLDKINDSSKQLEKIEKKADRATSKLETAKSQLTVVREDLEYEQFALYTPQFKFQTVDEYKQKLKAIRDQEKAMIKNDTAASSISGWTVNDSKREGKKMVSDTKKLLLRAFNLECDAAVNSVRFNNYDRCVARIRKSADTISKLGKTMQIKISPAYVNLKIDELTVALEYAIAKQEEKERIRELRAQEREEAKLRKEIEEARKKIEKEQQHFKQALKDARKQLERSTDPQEKENLAEKIKNLTDRVEDLNSEMESVDYREANQKAGYVYIISNIGAFGENVYKIGMTRRLDPQDRVDELGDASVPFRFDVHAMIFTEDAPKLEKALHKAFDDRKVNMINQRREFFNVSLDEIKKVVKMNFDKTVEFVDFPPAEQYRESIKLRENVM